MISSAALLNKKISPFPPLQRGDERISRSRFFFGAASMLVVALLFLPVVAGGEEVGRDGPKANKGRNRIVVYPIENLTGAAAPIKEIRKMCIEKLKAHGVDVLEEELLEQLMAKYRVRYTGGINREIAKALKQDVDVEGILINSLEFYSDANPPKISLISRLVSTGEDPSILWIDGVGLAGDDSPGILDLGLIEDPNLLMDKALKTIMNSLMRYLSGGPEGRAGQSAKKKFNPKIFYRSPVLEFNRKYTVAIAPFFSISDRKYVGEIMGLHFARELKRTGNFNVIEPGIVRQVFLELRIVMEQGVSLANAELIFGMLNADLVVSGEVIDYEDYQGIWGKPKVSFSAQLIERRTREVMWSSHSYNEGDDGVFFFDRGRVNTASAMTSQMIQAIGRMMFEDSKRGQGVAGSRTRVK